ncbi:sialate O-acetylesterase [Amphiplicatus metriothermophilus]|uniref:Sialate O-acetylesterase n=1 Tax=Amphiplicatus metriothermophilus TaxID=1519374 RepID=A0A239PY78_9PROT|nr:sialate O-acetylesterase [Amphiplicatus metriothermophilus]MBB5518996.1 sialate O-acetylesterase [Amphiplicatus metriothermophilus]SNT74617.1 sialate O-acetylesterase [Amphiplicatus metriothermophilus]
MRVSSFAAALSALWLVAGPAAAAISFDAAFSDHMVLQQGAPIAVSGTAEPGAQVSVAIGGRTETARADEAGAWRVVFPPMQAGGPYEISARGADGDRRVLSDVLVGDVFLCSGQSNMAWPVSRALNPEAALAASAKDSIRLLKIERASAVTPAKTLAGAPQWRVSGPESAADFSALCFFFGKRLSERYGAPIGLIDSSWGGSRIEAWISAERLAALPRLRPFLELLALYADDPRKAGEGFAALWTAWWNKVFPDAPLPWTTDEAAGWPAAPDAKSSWKDWGAPELADHDGMVWFAKTFVLSEAQAAQDAVLFLGGVDEVDMTWLNGAFIGGMFGWGDERRYEVPAEALRAGENELFVNVYSSWAGAGMYGPDEKMRLVFPDGSSIPLAEGWRYRKVSAAAAGAPPQAPWQSINGLSGLYNAMIAPLGEMRLKGVLWYQGESNTGEPETYETLLRLMINDWRAQFGADLPFLVVQLPAFGAAPSEPAESGWAGLRDAQRRAVADDPLADLVVAIDLGDPHELHPPNKQAVAERAVRRARRLIYGEDSVRPAPAPLRAERKGDAVTVFFANAGDTQIVSAREPIAFELCEAAPGACRFVAARLDGDRIVLKVPRGLKPARVRYCWGDAPICNWRDAHATPVTPFELAIE